MMSMVSLVNEEYRMSVMIEVPVSLTEQEVEELKRELAIMLY